MKILTIIIILIVILYYVLGIRIPIQDVTDSFSIEELNKIKFLIKFAKVNNIMDKINEMKGHFVYNDTSKWNLEGIKEYTNYHKDNNDINEIKGTLNALLEKVDNIENVLLNKEHNNSNEFLNIIKNKVKVKNNSKPSIYSPLLNSHSEIDIDDDDEFIRKNLQHKK